jgi:diguanylate cyclase (GGDEF)-like protein/PAS domain S-box-containing protein
MGSPNGFLLELVGGAGWQAAASIALCIVLLIWTVHYRRRYLAVSDEYATTLELIDHLSEGIYRSSPDGRQLSANPALVRLNGYDSEAELLAAVRDIAQEWYVEPGRRAEFRAMMERDGKVEDFVSEVYRHKSRERIWISECARTVRDKTGKTLFYEGSVREITETIKRLKLEEHFQKLTKQLPGGLFQVVRRQDGRYATLYLSSGFSRMLELPEEMLLDDGSVFVRHIHEADRPLYLKALQHSAAKLEPLDLEFRVRTASGEEKWLRATAEPEAVGEEITWHGYIADISLRKRQQIEIEELAYFDPLTHLPNRRMLVDRLTQALAACGRRGDRGALLFIDLDNFKTLNDTHGHDIGDAFLAQVAGRLKETLRKSDTVARIGGDEFVVIAQELGRDHASAVSRGITIANQILGSFREGFELGELRHQGSASIGVVVFDGTDTRVEEILKQADLAMYQAKAAGRDGVALFDPPGADRAVDRERMTSRPATAMNDPAEPKRITA